MFLLRKLRESSYSTQWLILGIALLVLGGATATNVAVERQRTEEREQARLMTQARVIQENVEANLVSVNRVLLDFTRGLKLARGDDLDRRLEVLAEAMPGVRTLLLLDGEGRAVASNQKELRGGNFAHREYFSTVRDKPDTTRLYLSAPFRTSLGVYGMSVARMVPGEHGEFAGLMAATLDPEYFRTLMSSVLYTDDMWTAVAHGDGTQFLMVPDRDGQVGKNLAQPGSFFSRHRDSGRTSNVFTGVVYATGEERMMAIRSVQPAQLAQDKPLVVAAGRRLDAIYAAWEHDARVQGALFGLIALGSIVGLYAAQRRQREFERRQAEAQEALAASERFLRAVTDSIPGMVGYWTRELRCRFANAAYLEWFGRTPAQMTGIRIQDLMGPELFAKNEPYMRAALRGERQRFERTLIKADGSTGYTWAQYIPDVHDGEVHGFFVLVSDVTELKQAEIALAESELKLKTIIETEPECVKVLSPDGKLLQMNRAGLEMIEADSEDQVKCAEMAQLVLPQYRAAFVELGEKVNRGESGTLEFEIEGLKGGHRWLDTHAVPLRDADGRVTGLLGVTRDITARKRIEHELERLAQTDPLTGLANRRHFTTLAEQELSRALRYGGSLSVLMMDLDHFKRVNDTYGHKAGDAVLKRFAELVRAELREVDVVGRVGGEEFAVLLPETDAEHAREVAERLRCSVAAGEAEAGGGRMLRFTVSIGVASLGEKRRDLDALLTSADRALYRAKSGGRNAVCADDEGAAAASA